jgi:FKBP-type peptidyl-prolyl cis-trans isomerase SlyD
MTSIAANKVATIHYHLTDDDGETIDSSRDGDPMPYLHGAGNIVPGLERELEGKAVGDRFEVVVEPTDGYGDKTDVPPQAVPREAFEGAEPEPGMPLVVEDESGNQMQLWVCDIDGDQVLITPDHPLAGVTLHFEVEVIEVRDATSTELEHGHAHAGDDHHH